MDDLLCKLTVINTVSPLTDQKPHHACGVSGAWDEVDAAGVQRKAGYYICTGEG